MQTMVIIGIMIVLVNIVCWRIVLPHIVQGRIHAFQSELVEKYYEEIENMYRTMRMWKHNYHNHLQVMNAYLSMHQLEDLAHYLEEMQGEMAQMEVIIKTGNIQVDAILNSKISLMKKYDIVVDATAIVPSEMMISGTELSVLLGNLLDNALEACLKIKEPSERFVRIYIDVFKRQLYICITNAMVGRAYAQNGLWRSTKNSRHGFGILSIDHIAKKYNGYINRKSEEGVFATEIMLPIA